MRVDDGREPRYLLAADAALVGGDVERVIGFGVNVVGGQGALFKGQLGTRFNSIILRPNNGLKSPFATSICVCTSFPGRDRDFREQFEKCTKKINAIESPPEQLVHFIRATNIPLT